MPSPGFADLMRLRHLARINRAIATGRPTAKAMAKALQVNQRTILRYVDWLRRELGAPIVFDFGARQGYRYSARFNFRRALIAWMEET